jgi:hypothetical protein
MLAASGFVTVALFVCHQVADGGVTTSPALDTHGKSLSSRLLLLNVQKNLD